ncbi:hypothetical protein IHE44_0000173, partial [Lamprotornis superbus]
ASVLAAECDSERPLAAERRSRKRGCRRALERSKRLQAQELLAAQQGRERDTELQAEAKLAERDRKKEEEEVSHGTGSHREKTTEAVSSRDTLQSDGKRSLLMDCSGTLDRASGLLTLPASSLRPYLSTCIQPCLPLSLPTTVILVVTSSRLLALLPSPSHLVSSCPLQVLSPGRQRAQPPPRGCPQHSQTSGAQEMEIESADEVAIVGIGCNFPGGEGIDSFWKVLEEGKNCTIEIPAERFNAKEWYDADDNKPGKICTTRAALLDEFNTFDNHLFGINNMEAERMDPQQKLLIECTYKALEDAGVPVESVSGSRTVYRLSQEDLAHMHFLKDVVIVCGNQQSECIQNVSEIDHENISFHILSVASLFRKAPLKELQKTVHAWISSMDVKQFRNLSGCVFQQPENFEGLHSVTSYFTCTSVPLAVLRRQKDMGVLSDIPLYEPQQQLFKQNAVYVVVGGLTGLGFETIISLKSRFVSVISEDFRNKIEMSEETEVSETAFLKSEDYITSLVSDLTGVNTDELTMNTPLSSLGIDSIFNTFDNHLFGINNMEAEHMDLQQKLLIECTYKALEDAGVPVESVSGTRTGSLPGVACRAFTTSERAVVATAALALFNTSLPVGRREGEAVATTPALLSSARLARERHETSNANYNRGYGKSHPQGAQRVGNEQEGDNEHRPGSNDNVLNSVLHYYQLEEHLHSARAETTEEGKVEQRSLLIEP